MKKKQIKLRDFQKKDLKVINDINTSEIRSAINKKQKQMNLTQNKFLTQKENYKFLKTIEFDNQRIGIVLKKNKMIHILLRYRYFRLISLDNIRKLARGKTK